MQEESLLRRFVGVPVEDGVSLGLSILHRLRVHVCFDLTHIGSTPPAQVADCLAHDARVGAPGADCARGGSPIGLDDIEAV